MKPTSLDPGDLAALERHPICDGVAYSEILSSGDAEAGIIWHEAGAVRPKHVRTGTVHVWVVSGSAELDGRPVTAGTYYFLDSGERPEVRAGPDGYVVFFVSPAG